MGFSMPGRRKLEHVYRGINIQRYGSAEGAGNEYLDYRRQFGDGFAWKFYEERGTGFNRCFSSYETPWTSTNHGIPVGVVAGPHILIVGQKRNLLVTISYSSYRNDVWDYAPDINDDIAYAVELLKRLSAASDSGAARGRL